MSNRQKFDLAVGVACLGIITAVIATKPDEEVRYFALGFVITAIGGIGVTNRKP